MIDVYLDSPDHSWRITELLKLLLASEIKVAHSHSNYHNTHIQYKGITSHQITTENLDEQMHDESIPTWRLQFSRATPRAINVLIHTLTYASFSHTLVLKTAKRPTNWHSLIRTYIEVLCTSVSCCFSGAVGNCLCKQYEGLITPASSNTTHRHLRLE